MSELRDKAVSVATALFMGGCDVHSLTDLILAWHARGVAAGREEAGNAFARAYGDAQSDGCDPNGAYDCGMDAICALPAPEGSEG